MFFICSYVISKVFFVIAVTIFLLCTFNSGQNGLFFLQCILWHFVLLSVSFLWSIKLFNTAFHLIALTPHVCISKMSSTISRAGTSIFPLYLYNSYLLLYFNFPNLSIVAVHIKLPHTVPCFTTFTLSVLPNGVFNSTFAFLFIRESKFSLSFLMPATNMSLIHMSNHNESKHFQHHKC